MKMHLCKITGYETEQLSHFKDHLKSKAYNLAYDKHLLEVKAMKRDELRKLHRDEGLTNYSKLKKDELITKYMEHMKHVEIKTKNNKKEEKKEENDASNQESNEGSDDKSEKSNDKSKKETDDIIGDGESEDEESEDINLEIENKEGIDFLSTLENNSVDLILTDPPYITSSETGMGNLHKKIKENKEKGIEFVKTEDEWNKVKNKYIDKKNMPEDKMKENYMKYGSIYGSKYSVQTEYGDWDEQFTMEILESFIKEYYKKLRKGGTLIIFFDIWKITPLKELLEKYKFKQIRFIEWIKTNPQPLNSSTNYLTNCREIALTAVKGGKPTFNS